MSDVKRQQTLSDGLSEASQDVFDVITETNIMGDNTPIDLQLNEEQIHTITGGCIRCEFEKMAIEMFESSAARKLTKAQNAAKEGRWMDALRHLDKRDIKLNYGQQLRDRIAARHPSP